MDNIIVFYNFEVHHCFLSLKPSDSGILENITIRVELAYMTQYKDSLVEDSFFMHPFIELLYTLTYFGFYCQNTMITTHLILNQSIKLAP